jgi:hypothetical protein
VNQIIKGKLENQNHHHEKKKKKKKKKREKVNEIIDLFVLYRQNIRHSRHDLQRYLWEPVTNPF